MRRSQVERGADRDDTRGIYLLVRHIIMALDVIEVHRFGNAIVLVKIAQIRPEMFVIDDAAHVALEMAVINGIEADEGGKETPIGFRHAVAEQIALQRQARVELIERFE